jgi:hypothetical protein
MVDLASPVSAAAARAIAQQEQQQQRSQAANDAALLRAAADQAVALRKQLDELDRKAGVGVGAAKLYAKAAAVAPPSASETMLAALKSKLSSSSSAATLPSSTAGAAASAAADTASKNLAPAPAAKKSSDDERYRLRPSLFADSVWRRILDFLPSMHECGVVSRLSLAFAHAQMKVRYCVCMKQCGHSPMERSV